MARLLQIFGFVVAASMALPAQAPEPPLQDTRLTVHTLVREDVFAGFLQNDMARLTRAEKNIDLLLASRPADRAALLAWQGGTALVRAALASEAGQAEQSVQQHRRAQALFSEAMRLGPETGGVFAVIGGSNVMLADRLPAPEREVAWQQAYASYQQLWKMQAAGVAKLPVHHRGELLSGLAQSAQRTGRTDEVAEHLDRILTLMPDTPYATRAQAWKDDPVARAQTRLTCQTCHAPGTLVARLAEVSK